MRCRLRLPRALRNHEQFLNALLRLLDQVEGLTRLLGPFLVVCATLLITLMTWTYFDCLTPLQGMRPFSLRWDILTSVGIWILLNICYNYFYAVATPPGQPGYAPPDVHGGAAAGVVEQAEPGVQDRLLLAQGGAHQRRTHEAAGSRSEQPARRDVLLGEAGSSSSRSWHDATAEGLAANFATTSDYLYGTGSSAGVGAAATGAGASEHSAVAVGGEILHRGGSSASSTVGWCRKCVAPKPARCHHCHVCRRCVLKMDHHCPWVNNCVGHANYHYFFKTLFYIWAGTVFIACLSFRPFLLSSHALLKGTWLGSLTTPEQRAAAAWVVSTAGERWLLSPDTRVALCFSVGVAVSIAVGLLFGWHIYLVFTNQTSVEWHINQGAAERARSHGEVYKNPYDLGLRGNWHTVFGSSSCWRWMLPWQPKRAPGDGWNWTTAR